MSRALENLRYHTRSSRDMTPSFPRWRPRVMKVRDVPPGRVMGGRLLVFARSKYRRTPLTNSLRKFFRCVVDVAVHTLQRSRTTWEEWNFFLRRYPVGCQFSCQLPTSETHEGGHDVVIRTLSLITHSTLKGGNVVKLP